MSKRVLILDTSVLCCWLQVPGKEEAGPVNDRWNHGRINTLLDQERAMSSTFVLPIATLIETGNHIAQAPSHRFVCATSLAGYLREAADAQSPWAAFTDYANLSIMESNGSERVPTADGQRRLRIPMFT